MKRRMALVMSAALAATTLLSAVSVSAGEYGDYIELAQPDEEIEITYDGDPIKIELTHGNSEEDAQGVTAIFFEKRVEELSQGKIDVVTYPNGQIVAYSEQMSTILSGGIDGGYCTTSIAEAVNTLEGIFAIPFLIYADDIETARKLSYAVTNDPLIEGLLKEEAAKAGFYRVADPQNSIGGLLFENNKRPVSTKADAAGLKIRTTGGTNLERLMGEFGASSVIIAGSELAMSLSQGVCDGVASSIDFIDGIGATCKYITLPCIYDFPNPLYLRADVYESLPDDLKACVDQAGRDAEAMIYNYSIDNFTKIKDKVEAEGSEITYLDMDDPETAEAASNLLRAGIEDKIATGGDAAQQIIDRIFEIKEEMGIPTIEY